MPHTDSDSLHLIDPQNFAQGWYASAILSPVFNYILLIVSISKVMTLDDQTNMFILDFAS